MRAPEPRPEPTLVEVIEGGLSFAVPLAANVRGPGRADGSVFYNPAMALARDVSACVAAVQLAAHRRRSERRFEVLDLLAGTGLRGVRIGAALAGRAGGQAAAAGAGAEGAAGRPRGAVHVTLNDRSAASREVAQANAARHLAPDAFTITSHSAERVLPDGSFHYLDVDPYGTPAPFLPLAFHAVRDQGILGLAATDTTVLAGVYPDVAARRYGARSVRGAMCHEVGLRILLGWLARLGAAWDLAVTPLLTHSTDHYLRAYVRVKAGSSRADAAMERVGTMKVDGHVVTEGVWTGPLADPAFIAAARLEAGTQAQRLEHRERVVALLTLLETEAELPPGTHDVADAARRTKASPPTMEAVLSALRKAGHRAERTHLNPTAVRGDFTSQDLDGALRRIAG